MFQEYDQSGKILDTFRAVTLNLVQKNCLDFFQTSLILRIDHLFSGQLSGQSVFCSTSYCKTKMSCPETLL